MLYADSFDGFLAHALRFLLDSLLSPLVEDGNTSLDLLGLDEVWCVKHVIAIETFHPFGENTACFILFTTFLCGLLDSKKRRLGVAKRALFNLGKAELTKQLIADQLDLELNPLLVEVTHGNKLAVRV